MSPATVAEDLDAEELLALALSSPFESLRDEREITATANFDERRISLQFPKEPSQRGQILCSKECIGLGLGLFRLWQMRGGPETETSLYAQMINVALEGARAATFGERRGWSSRELAQLLDAPVDLFSNAEESVDTILRVLEDRGLVYDPFITASGIVVFALGLVPVKWSVRTRKGETTYRDFEVHAGLWDVRRKIRGGSREWAFEFRGIRFVQKFITNAAREILDMEDHSLRQQRRPRMRRKPDPKLPGHTED